MMISSEYFYDRIFGMGFKWYVDVDELFFCRLNNKLVISGGRLMI